MTEFAPGALVDVALDLLPIIFVVPDFFAVGTDRHHLLQLPNLSGVTENSRRNAQSRPKLFKLQRLREKIVDPRVRRLPPVFVITGIRSQEDKISVFGTGQRSD